MAVHRRGMYLSKTWVWLFSFPVKTKLRVHLDSTACLGRAPIQSLGLYSATFSVITCIQSIYSYIFVILWSNSAPSFLFISFQHVQKWLAREAVAVFQLSWSQTLLPMADGGCPPYCLPHLCSEYFLTWFSSNSKTQIKLHCIFIIVFFSCKSIPQRIC